MFLFTIDTGQIACPPRCLPVLGSGALDRHLPYNSRDSGYGGKIIFGAAVFEDISKKHDVPAPFKCLRHFKCSQETNGRY